MEPALRAGFGTRVVRTHYFHTFSDAEWWIYSEGQPTIYWEGQYLAELRLNVNPVSYGVLPCLDCGPEGSELVTVRETVRIYFNRGA